MYRTQNALTALHRLALAGLGALLLGAAPAGATSGYFDDGQAPSRPYGDWFHVDDEAARVWTVSGLGEDIDRVRIERRKGAARRSRQKREQAHVLFLFDLLPQIRAIASWDFPPLNGRRRKAHEAQPFY